MKSLWNIENDIEIVKFREILYIVENFMSNSEISEIIANTPESEIGIHICGREIALDWMLIF